MHPSDASDAHLLHPSDPCRRGGPGEVEVVSLLGGEDEVNVPLKMPFLGAASLVGQISSPGGGSKTFSLPCPQHQALPGVRLPLKNLYVLDKPNDADREYMEMEQHFHGNVVLGEILLHPTAQGTPFLDFFEKNPGCCTRLCVGTVC